MDKKVFIDLGAHNGCSVRMFCDNWNDYTEYEIHSFEPHDERYNLLVETGVDLGLNNFFPIHKAAYDTNDNRYFDGWELTKHPNSIEVPCVDISQYILDNFSSDDYIILKFDIEGSEYAVINKMYNDGSLSYINEVFGELHGPKKRYTIKHNDTLIRQIEEQGLKLYNWDALAGTFNGNKIQLVPFHYKAQENETVTQSSKLGHSYLKKNTNG